MNDLICGERIGVIHGRFQPPHKGHLEYLLAGKEKCDFLYIGIANPDPGLTAANSSNPQRSLPNSNPFSYWERLLMLREAMLEAGVSRQAFEIVPFPINYPKLIKYYVPSDATFFVTIYDEWGHEKVKVLRSLGITVDIMWERPMSDRLTTGTEIRSLMKKQEPWQHLVPNAVFSVVKQLNLEFKIRNA
jgi:cytidyltransferase-like protein